MATQVRPPRALAERIGETTVAVAWFGLNPSGSLPASWSTSTATCGLFARERDSWLTSMAEFLSFSSQLPLLVVCTNLASAIVLLVFASAAPLVAAAAVWSEAMGPSSVRDSERETVEPVTPGQLSGRRGGIVGQQTRVGRLLDIGKGQGGGRSADQSRKGCG